MDILTRLDACAECEQAPLAPLLADAAAEIRMLRKDAERYRWLVNSGKYAPAMHGGGWGLRIGAGSKSTKVELDAAIDAAMNGANARHKPRGEATSA